MQDVFLNNKSFYASGGMLRKMKHFTMFAVNLRKKKPPFFNYSTYPRCKEQSILKVSSNNYGLLSALEALFKLNSSEVM